jgi:hypothetical protein
MVERFFLGLARINVGATCFAVSTNLFLQVKVASSCTPIHRNRHSGPPSPRICSERSSAGAPSSMPFNLLHAPHQFANTTTGCTFLSL